MERAFSPFVVRGRFPRAPGTEDVPCALGWYIARLQRLYWRGMHSALVLGAYACSASTGVDPALYWRRMHPVLVLAWYASCASARSSGCCTHGCRHISGKRTSLLRILQRLSSACQDCVIFLVRLMGFAVV